MKKVNYKFSKKSVRRKQIGKVTRQSRSSLAFVDANGNVFEVPRNTKGRPKGAKNK